MGGKPKIKKQKLGNYFDMNILTIKNLNVQAEGKKIISNLSLTIKAGELQVIMGPNGSGKSSLAQALIGNPEFNVSGTAKLAGKDLLKLKPEERAKAGLFLAWQYPKEIDGVRVSTFLKASYEALKRARNKNFQPLLMLQFRQLVLPLFKQVGLKEDFFDRYLNQRFSGGEKKKLEIIQLLLLQPRVIILDEIDSGLDIDALKSVGKAIHSMRQKDRGIIVITHYDRILKYLKPDCYAIMHQGKLVKTGGAELLRQIEKRGYESFSK